MKNIQTFQMRKTLSTRYLIIYYVYYLFHNAHSTNEDIFYSLKR